MRTLLSLFISLIVGLAANAQNTLYVLPGAMGTGMSPGDPTDLQTAINLAVSNGPEDVIRLADGVYSAVPYVINLTGGDGNSITLSGSWSPDFNSQSENPVGTVLDGLLNNRVLDVNAVDAAFDVDLNIEYLTITQGLTTDANGAGININCGSGELGSVVRLNMNYCDITSNITINSGNGAGIYTNGPVDLNYCLFDNNEASSGGAMLLGYNDQSEGVSRNINESVFINNYNYGNQGHDIWTNCQTYIEDSSFYGRGEDASSGNGSAVWINSGGYTRIDRCSFEDIRIQYWGSAVQAFNGSADIANSLFVNNFNGTLSGHGTLAYYHNNSSDVQEWNVTNCTFIDNTSLSFGNYGAAIHWRGDGSDQIYVSNCLSWGNGTNPLYKESGNGTVSNCLSDESFFGFTELTTTLNDDPLLDPNYKPTTGSPAVDAGDQSFDVGTVDYNGNIRVLGENVDIGCLEYNAPPSGITLNTTSVEENNTPGLSLGALMDTGQSGDENTFELAEGNGVNDADNGSFSINAEGELIIEVSANYEEQSEYHIYLKITDSANAEADEELVIQVIDVNETPDYAGGLLDQSGIAEEALDFDIDVSGFSDPDQGDLLAFTATLTDDTALPAWLSFNPAELNFTGTPPSEIVLDIRITATDQGGLSTYGDFNLSIDPVGLLENQVSEFKVFPNPTSEQLYLEIDLTDIADLFLLDSKGRIVRSLILNPGAQSSIDLSGLPAGMYILDLSSSEGRFRSIVMKQ